MFSNLGSISGTMETHPLLIKQNNSQRLYAQNDPLGQQAIHQRKSCTGQVVHINFIPLLPFINH